MIALLTGENTYRIRQSLDAMLAEARDKHGADAISRVDGSTVAVDSLPQLLTGASLFSSAQVVVLNEPSRAKAVWDRLGELLEHIDDATTLIIVDSKPDKRTKTYKLLQAMGAIKAHGLMQEGELVNWLQSRAREGGRDLEAETARYLMQYAGSDQWRLHHEIEKLLSLETLITPQLIRDVIEPEPRASAFEVLDAALSGNRAAAESQLEALSSSEDPYRFFGLLASQVYAIAVCKAAGGRPADQVAKDAGLHPFVVKKTMNLARRYEQHEVRRLVELVADCDVRMKTSGTDPWVLMKLTVGAIAART
jgi:DNA polymerase-3 subunit delta